MPQKFLDFTQVRPHVEKMGGVTVAQAVGMNAIIDPALLALAEYCQVILNLDEFLYVE